ncbi:MAG: hypothetical protein KDB88_02375 [Flavobacteriales bacterium]|nr:hypothetical protein [Flavobacteriales bacterium]
MTRAEKRYFKLHVSRHKVAGQSVQKKLFDAMSSMEVYDEEALLHKFKDRSFTNRFAITKRRLYESILHSLTDYHAGRSVDAQLMRRMQEVDILMDKALYSDGLKLLRSIEKQAERMEKHTMMLEVIQRKRRALEREKYADRKALMELVQLSEDTLARIAQIDALWSLKSRVFASLYRIGQVRGEGRRNELRSLLDDHSDRHQGPLLSDRARYLFHHLQSAAAFALSELENCHEHLSANLKVMETAPSHFIGTPGEVLAVLSNLTYVSMRMGRHSEARKLLARFRGAPAEWGMPDSDDLELKLFTMSYSLELSIHSHQGAFDKAIAIVPAVDRGLQRYGDSMDPLRKGAFHYQCAYACYGHGELGEALKWCHRLLNGTGADGGAELVGFGRVLELVIRCDKGDHDLLGYTLRNAERSFRIHHQDHHFETIFFRLVKQLIRSKNAGQTRSAYEQFLLDLGPVEKNPFDSVVFEHFDPVAWATCKIEGGTYAGSVRRRAERSGKAA